MQYLSKSRCLMATILCGLLVLFSVASAADSDAAVSKEVYEKTQEAQEQVNGNDHAGALRTLNNLYDPDKLTEYEQANVLNYIGWVYYNKKDLPNAIKTYEEMVSIPSLDLQMKKQTTYTLAQLYTMEEQYPKALEALDKWFTMEANPAPEPFVLKAQSLYQLQRFEEMIAPIETAMRIARERDLAVKEDWYVLLNFAYFQEENYARVSEIQKILLEKWPKERYVMSLVGAYSELGQWDDALQTVNDWLATEANPSSDLYITKATILYQLQRHEERIQTLELAVEIASSRGDKSDTRAQELLDLAKLASLPDYCQDSFSKPNSNDRKYFIPKVEQQWKDWNFRHPSDLAAIDKMTVAGIRADIREGCQATQLRRKFQNIGGQKNNTLVKCIGDPSGTQELAELHGYLSAQGRGRGGYFPTDGCREGVLNVDKCARFNELVDQLATTSSSRCENWSANTAYSVFIQEIEERDAQVLAAQQKEQQRLEKQRHDLQRRQTAEAQADKKRVDALAAASIPVAAQVLWGSKTGSYSTSVDPNPTVAFNETNKKFLTSTSVPTDLSTFQPPTKSEFEKSEDYENRVASLREEHQQKVASTAADLANRRSSLFADAWNSLVGVPGLDQLQYDADREVFTAIIGSKSGYSIPISIAVPIGEAEARKAELSAMRPWVLFSLEGKTLTPRKALLQNGNNVVAVSMQNSGSVPFAFGQAQLTAYDDQLRQQQIAKDERKRQAEAAKARRYPYIASIECTVNGSSIALSACLRTDGQIRVVTSEGTSVYTLPDLLMASTHTEDLTQSFQVGVQVGTKSSYGTLTISIIERTSYQIVGSQIASGAGDFALITN